MVNNSLSQERSERFATEKSHTDGKSSSLKYEDWSYCKNTRQLESSLLLSLRRDWKTEQKNVSSLLCFSHQTFSPNFSDEVWVKSISTSSSAPSERASAGSGEAQMFRVAYQEPCKKGSKQPEVRIQRQDTWVSVTVLPLINLFWALFPHF